MRERISFLFDELVELSQQERHKASWELDDYYNELDEKKKEIMSEIFSVREEVRKFAEVMEKKLSANEHKGGWDNCSIDFLTYRLRQEQAELFQALTLYYKMPNEQTRKLVEDECADVANFALFISDLVNKEENKK